MHSTSRTSLSLRALAACAFVAVSLGAASGSAQAAEAKAKVSTSAAAEARAQLKRDLATCDSNRATEDRATCRTEANRAYAEARAGNFAGSNDQYAQNARARCAALKDNLERSACEDRMSGQGTTQGSVAGGGILREKTVTVPAK